MSRVYGLHPWHLRRMTIAELEAYRADLIGRPREEQDG